MRSLRGICLAALWLATGLPISAPNDPLPNEEMGIPFQVWEQTEKLIPFRGAGEDQFGYSVALSGDTAVVGAPFVETIAPGPTKIGAACIFERNEGGPENWGEVTQLIGSGDSESGHHGFGFSVAIDGDWVVVGSYLDTVGNASQSGAAYVFHRNQGGSDNWGEVTRLAPNEPAPGGQFGRSVSISGSTIVVGSRTPAGSNPRGAAYVFERNYGGSNSWVEVRKLQASDVVPLDDFGWSVSIYGDALVVGAPQNVTDGRETGAAYTFDRNHGGSDHWGQVRKLFIPGIRAGAVFGVAVSISSDTIAVGARLDDNGTNAITGATHIFERNHGGPSNWGHFRKLLASDAEDRDGFGWAVALEGDNLIVGTPFEDDVCPEQLQCNSGAGYIFRRNHGSSPNGWGEITKLTSSWDSGAEDYFGHSVTIDGNSALVGAHLNDDAGNRSGSAYSYEQILISADLTIDVTATLNHILPGGQFAYIISVSNSGPIEAQDVFVTTHLPDGLTLVLADGCEEGANAIPNCSLGSVAAGTSSTLLMIVTAPDTPGLLNLEATVASSTPEDNPGDEYTIETVEVITTSSVVFRDGFESSNTAAWQ